MLSIQFAKFAKARVYRDEAMPGAFTGHELTVELASPHPHPAQSRVGLEAMVPRGGRIEYGFLGGSVGLAAGVWSVRVLSALHDMGPLLPSGLVSDARIGLPVEYAARVFRSLQALGEATCGLVSIDHAAHSLTGSSSSFFEKLAVNWFVVTQESPTDVRDLRSILEDRLL
jgi:hypothetical protein